MDHGLPMRPPEDAEGRTAPGKAEASNYSPSQDDDDVRNTLSPGVWGGGKSQNTTVKSLRCRSRSPALSGRLSPAAIPDGPYYPLGSSRTIVKRSPSSLQRFWMANKPAILVAVSQLFGATMNLSARLLELEGEGMHPMQMLLLRHSVTSAVCLLYMWWVGIEHSPFGRKDLRWLLLIRGCSGFVAIFGTWWAMMYIPLADATVITFLAPGIAGFVCYFLLNEPFTGVEKLATLVALLGVVLIAQPAALFAGGSLPETATDQSPGSVIPGADHETTPRERLLAVGMCLVGVCGSAAAFTTLRAIGKRAHPLISVNAFAMISTIVCAVALCLGPVLNISQPSLHWVTPTSAKQWLLLFSLGGVGFVMQYLLTAGLAADKSNRANAMVYTHMLFAASFDRWIFGHRMGLMSFAGCALILGSAVGVIFMKSPPPLPKVEDVERQNNMSGEAEASPMLVSVGGHEENINLERLRSR